MFLNLHPQSGVPLYRQIHQQMRAKILSGSIACGEQIPSAREFSAQLKVNPLTIQKVYQILESEGLVETRRGLGTFVVEKLTPRALSQKIDLLRPQFEPLVHEAKTLGIEPEILIDAIRQEYQK